MPFSAGLYDCLTLNNQSVLGIGGTGTWAAPLHLLIDGFEDLDATDERKEIGPLKIRRYDTEMGLIGQRKIDFGFHLACEPGNAVWELLHGLYQRKQPFELFAFFKFVPFVPDTGLPATGSRASRATVLIMQWNPPQKLEGIDVNELKLMASLNPADPSDVNTPTVKEPDFDYVVP